MLNVEKFLGLYLHDLPFFILTINYRFAVAQCVCSDHICTCRGSRRQPFFPRFENLNKIIIFWAVIRKYLGKARIILGGDKENLGKSEILEQQK